ncbi:MAG: YceI family protein, partial [Cyclobacteriaceae bacterium]|nr:YceI family protein [Cyclobacteriaceae bacterium]
TLAVAGLVAIATAFTTAESKLVSKNGHINFFSHTAVEDISADNYKVVSTLDIASGEVVFSVPMQSFEFEKAKMQQHYNSEKFLDTKTYPKAKFKGNITNLSDIDFSKNGTYDADVSGELTIHGVTKPVTEKGTITVNGDKVLVETKMQITLADYEIAFEKGKPSTNIAKTIDVTVKSEFENEKIN